MASSLRWALVVLLGLHGLIHLMGAVKGFGIAGVPQLTQPISRTGGLGWLAAGVAVLLTAALLAGSSGAWVWTAPVAAVISQAMIVSAWDDAKYGTIGNVVLIVAAAWGLVSEGPGSLRAEYRRVVAVRTAAAWPERMVTDADATAFTVVSGAGESFDRAETAREPLSEGAV